MATAAVSVELYVSIGLVIGFVLGYWQRRVVHNRNFQNYGEALVAGTLRRHFKTEDYHLLNHITLRHRGGTTQVDHILVSRFGVFVIETKDYTGWIFAHADHATWTQVTFKDKFKFQNPIHQNYLHVKAVQELFDFVPVSAIQSVVVFVGDAEFKTDMPAGVFTLPQLVKHLRSCTEEVLSPNRVQFCVGRLETARLAVSGETDVAHVQQLQRRYGQKS
jgi:Nuclease-related domain